MYPAGTMCCIITLFPLSSRCAQTGLCQFVVFSNYYSATTINEIFIFNIAPAIFNTALPPHSLIIQYICSKVGYFGNACFYFEQLTPQQRGIRRSLREVISGMVSAGRFSAADLRAEPVQVKFTSIRHPQRTERIYWRRRN